MNRNTRANRRKAMKSKRKLKPTDQELAQEAADIATQFHIQDIPDETRKQIHDELLLYHKRIDALVKTLMVLAYFEYRCEVMATGDVLGALASTDKWQEVVRSLCCHHVTHKSEWKEKRK